jgi:hypothetical protein
MDKPTALAAAPNAINEYTSAKLAGRHTFGAERLRSAARVQAANAAKETAVEALKIVNETRPRQSRRRRY